MSPHRNPTSEDHCFALQPRRPATAENNFSANALMPIAPLFSLVDPPPQRTTDQRLRRTVAPLSNPRSKQLPRTTSQPTLRCPFCPSPPCCAVLHRTRLFIFRIPFETLPFSFVSIHFPPAVHSVRFFRVIISVPPRH
mgnify:CR=1 FL=1